MEYTYGELDDQLLKQDVNQLVDTIDFADSETPLEDYVTSRFLFGDDQVVKILIKFINENSSGSVTIQEDEESLGIILDAYDGDKHLDSITIWFDDYSLPF